MKSAKELVAEANSKIETVPVQQALEHLHNPDVVFVDLRDSAEVERDGKIPGAVHVNRGMLEFVVDPTLPYHRPVFASGKKLVFYCASGGRSALAAATVQDMGLRNVAHMGGGFQAWREAGGAVEGVVTSSSR